MEIDSEIICIHACIYLLSNFNDGGNDERWSGNKRQSKMHQSIGLLLGESFDAVAICWYDIFGSQENRLQSISQSDQVHTHRFGSIICYRLFCTVQQFVDLFDVYVRWNGDDTQYSELHAARYAFWDQSNHLFHSQRVECFLSNLSLHIQLVSSESYWFQPIERLHYVTNS